MIPVRLELKNFMSYGEDVPPLDFQGLHMLCLSGENGNGKSALLDAITWSLWGESRAGKNKHDELVRIGADEMMVQFTFSIEDRTYRVLRKRSKRTGGNQWELHLLDSDPALLPLDAGPGGSPALHWRSLTGNTASETERTLHNLLRMSYDTFLNSAYLRQGRADEFVRQTSGKRKEILAEILDLARYDTLESRARDRAKESAAEATDHEREINLIDVELAREPGHVEAMDRLRAAVDRLTQDQAVIRTQTEQHLTRKAQLTSRKQMADTVRAQAAASERERRGLIAEIASLEAEIGRHKGIVEARQTIEADYLALREAQKLAAEIEAQVAEFHRTHRLLADAERERMEAEADVRRRLDRARLAWQQASGRCASEGECEQRRAELAARIATAGSAAAERKKREEQRRTLDTEFKGLLGANGRIKSQIEELHKRLAALAEQKGLCSVCNSPLPADRVAQVRAEYEEEIRRCEEEQKALRGRGTVIKRDIATIDEGLPALDAQISAAQTDRGELGQIEKQLAELAQIKQCLPELAREQEEAQAILESGAYAPGVVARIDELKGVLKRLESVDTQYRAVKDVLAKLSGAERASIELQNSERRLCEAQTLLEGRRERGDSLQKALEELQKQLADTEGIDQELAEVGRLIAQNAEAEEHGRREAETLNKEIGSHSQALSHCREQRVRRQDVAVKLSQSRKDAEAYDQLARAFGKKGVQALIIENAVPELQEEANRLLEKLTDGGMSLFFETVRDAKTKKDTPIETLEIKVSDSLGTRPLEMFSGGEAFRVAFAIRIALSKLLAHRAGARLQTLIIDEGFGTQDAKGREKLVEAITAIADEFAQIIVITHVEEMKDAFPARIEVTKTAAGSQIALVEGGAG